MCVSKPRSKGKREDGRLVYMRCGPLRYACDGVGFTMEYPQSSKRVLAFRCLWYGRRSRVKGDSHPLAINRSCAGVQIHGGLFIMWTERYTFCLASSNTCEKEVIISNNDRRATGMRQVHRGKINDTPWGRDGTTRVRPRLVYKMETEVRGTTTCISKLIHIDDNTQYTIRPCISRYNTGSIYIFTK